MPDPASPSPPAAAPPAARRSELPLPGQVLLLVTLALTAFGQVMVYSASSAYAMTHAAYRHDSAYFLKNGILFTVVGVLAMLVVMRIPPRWLKAAGPGILAGSLVLLVVVLVPGIGEEINGARRWLPLGPISIQPSELAKLGLLATVAALLAARRQPPAGVRAALLPIGALTALVCVLVLVEPDLGSALSIALMAAAMLLVAGTPVGVMVRLAAAGVALVGLAIYVEPYRRERFLAFLDPWAESSDGSYQVVQSIIAIGSGGVWGTGLGESVQKVNYLPEAHTDMIFAVIGEELGLVGTLLVVGAFGLFAWAGFSIALAAADRFGKLVAAGATALIVGQAGINLGAVMGILPLTGIPLPLISFGSSSRVVTLLTVGVLLSVCREGAVVRRRRPALVPATGAATGRPAAVTASRPRTTRPGASRPRRTAGV